MFQPEAFLPSELFPDLASGVGRWPADRNLPGNSGPKQEALIFLLGFSSSKKLPLPGPSIRPTLPSEAQLGRF